jgi:O-antigen/teichoic acid export membrane protein
MGSKNYTKKAIKGVSIVGVLLFISYFLSYILRIVLARNLTPEDYGLFYAVFSLIMFLLIFRDFGLGNALTKFIAQYNVNKDYPKIKTLIVSSFIFQLIASLLLMSSLLLLSSYLSINYFRSDKADLVLSILSVYILFSMFSRLMDNILKGFQDEKWYSWAQSIRIGSALLFFFPFYYLGFGVTSAALSFVVGVFLTFIFLFIGVLKYSFVFKYPLKDFWGTTKELFSYALPVIFTGFGNKIVAHLDVLLLTYFVPLAIVGVYNVILPTALLFLFIPRAVTMILFPMTSELWERKDEKRLAKGVSIIHTYLLLLIQPLVYIIFVFGDLFIGTFFGYEYVSGLFAFRILLVGVLFYVLATTNNSIISAIGKPFIVTKIVGIAAVFNIILNIIMIPIYGISGAALATTLSYLIIFTFSTKAVLKFIHLHSPWKIIIKSLSSGFVFLLVAYGIRIVGPGSLWLRAVVAILVAGFAYFLIIYILKLIDIKEIKGYLKIMLSR